MKVTTVSANIRYSQDTGHGAWKVVELGAEATVDQREEWTEAQASLYQQLGCQLKALWANSNGHKAQESAQDGSEKHGEPIAVPEPVKTPPEHFCQEHQTTFRQYHRGNSSWYAHKALGGSWCREK